MIWKLNFMPQWNVVLFSERKSRSGRGEVLVVVEAESTVIQWGAPSSSSSSEQDMLWSRWPHPVCSVSSGKTMKPFHLPLTSSSLLKPYRQAERSILSIQTTSGNPNSKCGWMLREAAIVTHSVCHVNTVRRAVNTWIFKFTAIFNTRAAPLFTFYHNFGFQQLWKQSNRDQTIIVRRCFAEFCFFLILICLQQKILSKRNVSFWLCF